MTTKANKDHGSNEDDSQDDRHQRSLMQCMLSAAGIHIIIRSLYMAILVTLFNTGLVDRTLNNPANDKFCMNN